MDRGASSALSRSSYVTYELLWTLRRVTGLITHMGANRAHAEHQGLSEEANTGSWAPVLSSFLAPSALEASSQLPMAVGGSSEITQGVEEVSQCCEMLSGLLSCSSIQLKPPCSHGYVPPGDCGAKT